MTEFFVHNGHLLTAMIVFAGVWLYVWSLDGQVKKLKQELKDEGDDL